MLAAESRSMWHRGSRAFCIRARSESCSLSEHLPCARSCLLLLSLHLAGHLRPVLLVRSASVRQAELEATDLDLVQLVVLAELGGSLVELADILAVLNSHFVDGVARLQHKLLLDSHRLELVLQSVHNLVGCRDFADELEKLVQRHYHRRRPVALPEERRTFVVESAAEQHNTRLVAVSGAVRILEP